jgi:hypothetical protein
MESEGGETARRVELTGALVKLHYEAASQTSATMAPQYNTIEAKHLRPVPL